MTSEDKEKYIEAIKHLNGLFRSERLMVQVRQNRKAFREQNLPNLWILLRDLSITQNDLDQLQVIHVTGTKGKGSTCTFIESILRHHGCKTLFYSSPHVREIRERIRLSGQPLSYEMFTKYFWEVYNLLKYHKNESNSVLHFYNFLMCLGVYVALKEKQAGNVEAVVIEGMVGGEFDFTNLFELNTNQAVQPQEIVRRGKLDFDWRDSSYIKGHNVDGRAKYRIYSLDKAVDTTFCTPAIDNIDKAVCCMTSIGLDHTGVLGPTVEDIAWNKSGIFRKNVPVISAKLPDSVLEVMRKRANEKGTSVTITPSLNMFGEDIKLGIDGDVQKINAPIALLAARVWIHKQGHMLNVDTIEYDPNCVAQITKMERQGLKNAGAFGKDLVVRFEGVTLYLDGAHTLESMQNCIKWFEKKRISEANEKGGNIKKILIFSAPPDRIPERLLTPLKEYPFDTVLFPVHLTGETESSLEHHTEHLPIEERIELATKSKNIWDQWNDDVIKNGTQTSIYCRSLIESVKRLSQIRLADKQDVKPSFYQVLVTGSTGMIGRFLRILDTVPEHPEYMLHPVGHLNGTDESST